MALMFEPLRRYADFEGRARRAEYWLFFLFVWILEVVLLGAMGAMAGASAANGSPPTLAGPVAMSYGVFALVMLGLLVPSLAVAVRRLHDTNRSGWWTLIVFIPFLGALAYLVFMVLDGTPGPNKYGEDPKGRASNDRAAPATA